ncbi:hypothetical protein VV869_23085 [Photobacterium sp. MCCC 1A19761]|uniref:hypothetical protein n=1 Tax=Photobacterium sp. MCCC 1A19761 TaxID=3115000 RepID=UPI00307F2329
MKTITLAWTEASEASGVTYTVCQKDTSQDDDCLALATVTDTLSASVSVGSLVRALSSDYFISASDGTHTARSNAESLTVDTANQMIGYFKTSKLGFYDQFGSSVALSDDGLTLAVGAPNESGGMAGIQFGTVEEGQEAIASGAVYLFKRESDRWSLSAYIKASNPGSSDRFGSSVSLSADGSTLAVGAPFEDGGTAGIQTGTMAEGTEVSESGAVYLFDLSDSDRHHWSQSAYVKAPNPGKDDNFGESIVLSKDGSTLAVGAPREDGGIAGIHTVGIPLGRIGQVTDGSDSGAVYLFKRESGSWLQSAYIKASNLGSNEYFGVSMALSADGSTPAVGTPFEDGGTAGIQTDTVDDGAEARDSGAVYLFDFSDSDPSHWSQSAYIKASTSGSYDHFGASVSLSADGLTLAVGAPNEDGDTAGIQANVVDEGTESLDSGAVYLFDLSNSERSHWSQSAYVKAPNPGNGDLFGVGLALSADGSTLVVGAPYEDGDTAGIQTGTVEEGGEAINSGAVYLY